MVYECVLGEFTGFPGFEPTHKLIKSPIPLAHDVVVEEVRNDVFDAHPARQSARAAVKQVRSDFFEAQSTQCDWGAAVAGADDHAEQPGSPDVFDVNGAQIFDGDLALRRGEGASAGDCRHAESASGVFAGEMKSSRLGGDNSAA
jgi:hypothetical protein